MVKSQNVKAIPRRIDLIFKRLPFPPQRHIDEKEVVKYLDAKMEYYYTASSISRALVEPVHPTHGQPYIRTKANNTAKDNLLNLPRF